MCNRLKYLKTGAIYHHFKGEDVQIMCLAKDSEDINRHLVIYKHLNDGEIYARELSMFLSRDSKYDQRPLDLQKALDKQYRYRFISREEWR